MFLGGDKMNNRMMRRFAFGHSEDVREGEENTKESPTEVPVKDVEDEEISVSELRGKVHEAEAKAASYRDKAVQANERASLFQEQVVETTKRAASLKAELEANLIERVSLEKTIHDLKNMAQETEKKAVCQQDRTAEANERAKLYQNQAVEATKQTASLKAELEAKSLAHNSLEKTIDGLKREIAEKETLATSYKEKVAHASDKVVLYQNQAVDATKRAALLKVGLEASSSSRHSLEKTVEELQKKVQEAEKKVEQKFSEDAMAKSNFELKEELEAQKVKVAKLEEMVKSIKVEKEELAERLALQTKAGSEPMDQQSRGIDAHLEATCRDKETEVKLLEATQKLKLRDSEVRDLKDKLLSLESQVSEATNNSEARQTQLDEALLEIKKLEGIRWEFQGKFSNFDVEKEDLANTNLKLSHDLARRETKLNDLQEAFEAALADKEETSGKLHSSRKTIEDLRQLLSSEGGKLQFQISSVMDENYLINEMHQATKKDLQAVISQLEEQLNEQKAKESSLNGHLDSLKADLMVKSELQAKLAELEQQLHVVDKQFKAEKEAVSKEKLEREASLERHHSETEAKTQQVQFLEKKLQISEAHNKREVEASMKLPLGEGHIECEHVVLLEEKVEELEKKLRIAEAHNKEKLEASMMRFQTLGEGHVECEHVMLLEKKVEELAQKLQIAEEKDLEEGNKLALANIELDEMRNKLSQTTELEMKIAELECELQFMKTKYSEQDLEGRNKIALINLELDGLTNKSNQTIELEKKMAELESELQLAKSGQKPEGVEAGSRDFSSGATTPSDVKKTYKGSCQTKEIFESRTITQQHHMGMAYEFVISIALLSIAIGVLLGKHVNTA